MSHFSKIKAQITDEEALRNATQKLGFALVENGACRGYYGTIRADLLVKLPGRYDVALMKAGTHYNISADFFGGYVERYVGPNAGILIQQYSAEKVRIEAYKKSLAVTEERDGTDIILTLTDTDTGGQVIAICHEGGGIEVRTQGFPGESCMKFEDLENALGSLEERKATMEMYQEEPLCGTEHIKNIT